MSRTLKFRAWTRQNPSMPWAQKFVAITGDGKQMVPIGGTFTGAWHALGDNDEGLIIEQYTGLKDKNGKEIYEGDIVEQFACGMHQRSTIWQVRWNKVECCFELHYLGGSLFGDSMMSDGDEYEIIGNIHENPKLIGGEE